MHDHARKTTLSPQWLAFPVMTALLAGCLTVDQDTEPSHEDSALEGHLSPSGFSSPSSAPLAEVDWEVEGFARERGISYSEAQQRLGWQTLAPQLDEQLRADLGDRLGGVWVDVAGGDRIMVGVVREAVTDAAAVVRDGARKIGLTEGYDIVPVRRSLAELERVNEWLGAEIEKVNDGAGATLTAGLRTDLNAVELQVPAEGRLTDAQRDLVATAKARLSDMIVAGSYAGRPTARACVYPYCDSPLRGGIRITNSGTGCTGAFVAKSKVDGVLYQFTAGHCAYENYDDWSTRFTDGSSHVVGPVHHWEWHKGGDMAILRIKNVAGWDPEPWVYVTSGPDTTTNTAYKIKSDHVSVLGMRICTTGAYYGRSDCGYVTQLGVTATYDGVTVRNLGRGSFCGMGGDSGSPMYASHVAYGLQVAGYSECDSLYQGIRAAESVLNVNVLHAAP
ncbi:S1 family peptidase [Sorangium sp. So ce1389]|uniref:S1 family peptidase n=1 Tax=Sorangium sp. So ce1389 TaxID=3133336 RepID=UPI003F6480BB